MSKQHYVYLHRKASDGAVFYVGKGTGRRAWASSGRNRRWRYTAEKHGFTVEVFQSGMSEPCALALERITIASLGKERLANLVEGGGGTSGWKHSEEAKRRIGAFQKGREFTDKMRAALEAANKNRAFTPATIQKMREAARRRKRGPLSAETRAKISASHMGLRPSEDTRRKLSRAKIGKACGRDSPSYDHTIRSFYHAEHHEFIGTRGDFMLKYGLPSPCVSAVITGRQKSVKGWRLR